MAVDTKADRVTELETKLARFEKRWKAMENFLSRVGTYYNTIGDGAIFFVDKLTNSGANGVALTPNQGLIEHFSLPMKLDERTEQERKSGVKIIGPCWVPEIIPEAAEEIIELFDSESTDSGVAD